MSLDDRLRNGLRTMEPLESDPARALEEFRASAYPRRTRRRVMQVIAGTVAAVALIAGVTTAVAVKANKKPGFIHPAPEAFPVCHAGDTQAVIGADGPVVSGRSTAYRITLEVYTIQKACRIDETIAPTITANIFENGGLAGLNTHQAPVLAIQGNESPGRLVGVVPTRSEKTTLSLAWTWTNWCGQDRSYSFSLRRVSGSTNTLESLEGGTATIAAVPSCVDASRPSVLTVSPVENGPLPTHGQHGQIDSHPHVISPHSGLEGLTPSPINNIIIGPDGKTLLVSLIHDDRCTQFAGIHVKESAHTVMITVLVGAPPGVAPCPGGGYGGDAARIVLRQPLGTRHLVDGSGPSDDFPVLRQTR
jgi:hypothetical protein